MDISDRIFELLDATQMEQQQFAELVGVSDDTASNWRRKKSASYTKYLPQIADVLDTTTEYLLTGQGPKCRGTPAAGLSTEQAELLGKFARLTPGERREILAFMDFKLSQRPPLSSGQGQEAM